MLVVDVLRSSGDIGRRADGVVSIIGLGELVSPAENATVSNIIDLSCVRFMRIASRVHGYIDILGITCAES